MAHKSFLDESVFARRSRLFMFINDGFLGKELLEDLIPEGKAHEYEKHLWDYKSELPAIPSKAKIGEPEKRAYNSRMAEVIKDVVSFYNSYGGYLVVGVTDKPRTIIGFEKDFNCDELVKRAHAVTRHDIDCHYVSHDIETDGELRKIGILFIPRRKDSLAPAQFLRDAYSSEDGFKAYKKGDIYFRQGSECKPATSSEEYSFLCSPGCRQFSTEMASPSCHVLDNNLGPRDPGFIRFIGREEYLDKLWRWLIDKYSPCKLLTGLGGVGKTTIAREFCEDIIRHSPMGFERVIWLSAKQEFFSAILGKYTPINRIDFTDTHSLLRAILLEVGWPENQVDLEWSREEIMEEVIHTFLEIPVFLVIDDIDSLAPEEQNDVFQTIVFIVGQTIGRTKISTRALLTARLDLGAAPGQVISVEGMKYEEFYEYVKMTAANIGLSLNLDVKSKQMRRFCRVTDGSPTFASSILRLLRLGESLESALNQWKGSDGQEIRRFAFKRELENLNDSQVRALYAASLLGDTSLLELRQVTLSSESLLKDDIGGLRQYHLLALGSEIPSGGSRLIVPNSIRLMSDIMRLRINDAKRIEKECAKARSGSTRLAADIGSVIYRVIALWKDENTKEALEVAQWANKKYRKDPDLKCLVGRAYLKIDPPKPRLADTAFRRAHDLGCRRPELYPLWLDAKMKLGDWIGILDVLKVGDNDIPMTDKVYLQATSYGELAEAARRMGNLNLSADYFLKGGEMISDLFKNSQARSRFIELTKMRSIFFYNYVTIMDLINKRPDEHVQVWLGTTKAFDCGVRLPDLIQLGIDRLNSWWEAVENRDHYDQRASGLMGIQLKKFDSILKTLQQTGSQSEDLIEYAGSICEHLHRRKTDYDEQYLNS